MGMSPVIMTAVHVGDGQRGEKEGDASSPGLVAIPGQAVAASVPPAQRMRCRDSVQTSVAPPHDIRQAIANAQSDESNQACSATACGFRASAQCRVPMGLSVQNQMVASTCT